VTSADLRGIRQAAKLELQLNGNEARTLEYALVLAESESEARKNRLAVFKAEFSELWATYREKRGLGSLVDEWNEATNLLDTIARKVLDL
jgi:hypothetical protein